MIIKDRNGNIIIMKKQKKRKKDRKQILDDLRYEEQMKEYYRNGVNKDER